MILAKIDDKNKIKIIKEIRTILGLGLKESKELVEKVPNTIKTGIEESESNQIKEIFEKLGCTIEVK